MSIKKIAERLNQLDCKATATADEIKAEISGVEIKISFGKEWGSAVRGFYKARQYNFDVEHWVLTGNRFAEYHIVRLDPEFFYRVEHKFVDKSGNKVSVAPASKEYCLSYFESDRYEFWFQRVRERIQRRAERRKSKSRLPFRAEELFPNFYTARYQSKRKPAKSDLKTLAEGCIKSCLFSLAYNRQESWELSQEIKSRSLAYTRPTETNEILDIPSVTYDSAAVTYYKVAKSSQFPSQIFLSYYHILEYHFLRIADENLHGAIRGQLNDPAFKPDYDNVSKLIATLKKNDSTFDEKEMLKSVIRKYVPEDEFIDFVKSKEAARGEKIYSGSKQIIFGESFSMKLEGGHALSNAAGILKQIRNALVHSSDRYSREDCFLPLSESEELIIKYIPLVQYLAEKVIFATAG